MGSVRASHRAAWMAHGSDLLSLFPGIPYVPRPTKTERPGLFLRGRRAVTDLLYIVLTFVGFGVLYLIVKGIETFER
jgi:hypothetical protein